MDEEVKEFAERFFTDKTTLTNLLTLWSSYKLLSTGNIIDNLFFLIKTILCEPVYFSIDNDYLYLFKNKKFPIPINMLYEDQIKGFCLFAFHSKDYFNKIIADDLRFSITYQDFRYNNILDKNFPRLNIILLFINDFLSSFVEDEENFKMFYENLFKTFFCNLYVQKGGVNEQVFNKLCKSIE